MAALDILLDHPGAEYKLAKAFSFDQFLCELEAKTHSHDPGDGGGERNKVECHLEWFSNKEFAGYGWFLVDAKAPQLVHFNGLYIEPQFQGKGIFSQVINALDVWHDIGIREGRVGGTTTSAPTFKKYGFTDCEKPILAGGAPLAIYTKPTRNSQDELES